MVVLIDTNVILNLLIRREPFYENAARINILSENGYINSYISASAVTDIYKRSNYFFTNHYGSPEITT